MNKKIVEWKSNPYYRLGEYHRTCPVCSGKLYYIESDWMEIVLDDNSVFHCENNEDHIFWRNPREIWEVLHLTPQAKKDNFKLVKNYHFIDESWVETESPLDYFKVYLRIVPEDKQILHINNVLMTFSREELFDLLQQAMLNQHTAERWYALDNAVGDFYDESKAEYEQGDFCQIGEIAAKHLGYV